MKIKKINFTILFLILVLLIKNLVAEISLYDIYGYNEFTRLNPALILISPEILLKVDNKFLIENEKYEENNMLYENQNSKFLPHLWGIIPINNKIVFSLDLEYNYSSSNAFNHGTIFETYETNQFHFKNYSGSFNIAKEFSKDLFVGYQLKYKKYNSENEYIENNGIYNYKYLRENQTLKIVLA